MADFKRKLKKSQKIKESDDKEIEKFQKSLKLLKPIDIQPVIRHHSVDSLSKRDETDKNVAKKINAS